MWGYRGNEGKPGFIEEVSIYNLVLDSFKEPCKTTMVISVKQMHQKDRHKTKRHSNKRLPFFKKNIVYLFIYMCEDATI